MKKIPLVRSAVWINGTLPKFRCLLLLMGAIASLCSGNVHAAVDTWNGTIDGSWSTPGNWSAGSVPASGDTALFDNSTGTSTIVLPTSPTPINSITFDTSAGAYTIGTTAGNALNLGSGGTIQVTSAVGNFVETINAPIKLLGSYTFTNNNSNLAGVLKFGGSITNGATSTPITLTLNGSNTGTNTISGVISNGVGSSTTAVNETAGTWVMSGNSTYTGGLTVASGATLISTNSGGLGATGLTLNGTLDLNVSNLGLTSLTGTGVITNTGSSSTSIHVGPSSGTVEFDGVIQNGTSTSGFTKTNAGTVILGGANTYTAGTGIQGGMLVVTQLSDTGASGIGHSGGVTIFSGGGFGYDNSGTTSGTTTQTFSTGNSTGGTITFDSSSASAAAFLSLNGTINNNVTTNTNAAGFILSGSNTGANSIASVLSDGSGGNIATVTKTGTGTWKLNGANTYGGSTTISQGTLVLGNAKALGSGGMMAGGSNGASVASGATLDLDGQTINKTITLSGTGTSGEGALINNSGTAATISGGVISGLSLTSGGSGYAVAPTVTLSGGATATATLGITSNSAIVASGGSGYTSAATVAITGGGGSGAKATLVIGTGAQAGQIIGIAVTASGAGYSNGTPLTFTITPNSGASGASLTGTFNYTVTGLTLTNAGSGFTTAPTPTLTGTGTGASALATLSGVVLAANSSVGGTGDITIGGAITDGGNNFSLTKVGANMLTLGSANAYGGGTIISAGTVNFTGAGTLGSTGAGLEIDGGALDVNGTTQTVGNLTGAGGMIVNNGTGTNVALTIGSGNGGGGTYSGVIADHSSGTGILALNKTGTGTITLAGANTYSGGTMISTGTLLANNTSGSATGSGTVTLNSGATLGGTGAINSSTTNSLNGIIQGGAGGLSTTGSLTITSSGTTSFGSTANLVFNLAQAGGNNQLNLGSSAVLFSGSTLTLNLVDSSTLDYSGTYELIAGTGGVNQFSGISVGSGGVISGLTLTLTGTASNGEANSLYYGSSFLFLNNGDIDIEVQSVPEPGTWVMMLGGLVLLVAIQIRRRKSRYI